MKTPLQIATAWQDAASRGDAEALVALSDRDIEIIGPRGSAYGHDVLREWIARAGIVLTPLRMFERGDEALVEGKAEWRSAETGEAQGEAVVASHFVVRDGRVVRYARYDSVERAVEAAGWGGLPQQSTNT